MFILELCSPRCQKHKANTGQTSVSGTGWRSQYV